MELRYSVAPTRLCFHLNLKNKKNKQINSSDLPLEFICCFTPLSILKLTEESLESVCFGIVYELFCLALLRCYSVIHKYDVI